MNIGRKLTDKEVAEIRITNPFWNIESPPLVMKTYKGGRRKRLFVNIQNIKYYIIQDKYGRDEWYEVNNESSP